jgi:hypothetical protein
MVSKTLLGLASVFGSERIRYSFGRENIQLLNSTLKVFYPENSYSPSKKPIGGVGFYVDSFEDSYVQEVLLSYQVQFDPTFDPVLGGKLPGFFVGSGDSFKGAAGGLRTDSASCRIAWRSDLKGEVYLYMPNNTLQPETYKQQIKTNGRYGDSLWKDIFQFERNVWNNVKIRLKLNTINQTLNEDGELEVTIGNTTLSISSLVWTTKDTKLYVMFETFFGGDTEKYATKVDTWARFRNIEITKLH